jgi:hypothetical protein
MTRSVLVWLGILTACVSAAAAIAVLTWHGDEYTPPPGSGAVFVEGALRTANRDRLAVCVDVVDGVASPEHARDSVKDAIDSVYYTPRWDRPELRNKRPVVDIGCPSSPLVLRTGVISGKTGTGLMAESASATVDEASYYALFVFVIADTTMSDVFRDAQHFASQEWFKHSIHLVDTVTTGIYLTPADLADEQLIADCMTLLLGLRQADEEFVCR